MIFEIDKVRFIEDKIKDPFSKYRNDIEKFWEMYQKNNPGSYSERILNVFDINRIDQYFTLNISWINFYEALYSKLTGNIKTRTLFSGGYIKTGDGYYCLAVDKNEHINLIGGVSSCNDFKDGIYDPKHCLIREFKEEIGVDIRQDAYDCDMKYIKIPDDNEIYSPVGLIYEIMTDRTKNELETRFANTNHDDELKMLRFFDQDERELFRLNKRRPYINDLFELVFKKA